jgi:hypothetical protein
MGGMIDPKDAARMGVIIVRDLPEGLEWRKPNWLERIWILLRGGQRARVMKLLSFDEAAAIFTQENVVHGERRQPPHPEAAVDRLMRWIDAPEIAVPAIRSSSGEQPPGDAE